eukprot:Skav214666  [mRNA]  locus=scaffold923:239124:241350:+ [translate_table: standard]
MTEPHLPGIPDLKRISEVDIDNPVEESRPHSMQEVERKPMLTASREQSQSELKAWLAEEFQRHNAALSKLFDEALDCQKRISSEKVAFQSSQGLSQGSIERAEALTDLRLAGLSLPAPPRLSEAQKSPPKVEKPEPPKAAPPEVQPPPVPPEASDGTSSSSSSLDTLSPDAIENQERRPSRMEQAWEEAQMEEKKLQQRRASQMLGPTYNRLVSRVEIDLKESLVDAIVSFLVVLYTFILLLQTQWRGSQAAQKLRGLDFDDEEWQDWPGAETTFFIVDHLFNALFVLEIAWRLYMHKLQFLCDIFGVFDVLVVIATSIDIYVLQPFDAGFAQNFAVGRVTRIFRLMRIFRVLRVMRFAKNLQQLRLLGDVLSKCLSPLMWALLILGVIMVGTGVLMSQLLLEYVLDTSQDIEKRQWVYNYYGTALKATYSVFEATFSGSWPLIARPLIFNVSEWYCIFWIAYQVVIGFAVMRVIGALFLNETIRAANSDGEAEEAFSQKVYQFFTAADASGDGRLSYEELEAALREPGVEAWLKALELEIHEAYTLFNLLDDDGDGEVSYDEFLHSALRLKGNARAIDSIMIMHEQVKMGEEINRLRDLVMSSFDEASKIRDRLQSAEETQQFQPVKFQPVTAARKSVFGDLLSSPQQTKAKLAQRRASEVHLRRPLELE